jgi:hypothetical protein
MFHKPFPPSKKLSQHLLWQINVPTTFSIENRQAATDFRLSEGVLNCRMSRQTLKEYQTLAAARHLHALVIVI